jgi:regulator of Ty1 transposition protein 103
MTVSRRLHNGSCFIGKFGDLRRRSLQSSDKEQATRKDSPSPKRLNLIYLANEVTQQSKARKKEDFVVAFSPIIAEATATAYKGATSELQGKLRRVIDVWKDRSIFEAPIQNAIESRIEGK